MQFNNLQSNNTHNASFAPNPAYAANQQQGANSQGSSVPPLQSAAALSANPAAKNIQTYHTSSPPQVPADPLAPDNWNLPEYQPIKPGAPYMEKLADEAMNTKKLNICLKNARDNEELEDFSDAEEAYEKALKYTENAAHYKLYAGCLREIYLKLSRVPLTPAKDEAQERLYKEKAARAFYYLGDLYQKQRALPEALAAYQASCELALYERPLQALVDVARHLGEATPLATALEKLADFYAQKGAITLAIDKLKEAFEASKLARILEKLEALYSGEGNQFQLHELAIQRFELQISQDPKNIGLYRDYAWFLKSIGKQDEARVVKKRIVGLLQQNFQTLQQKVIKQKTKIGGLKQTIHLQAKKLETQGKQLECLEKQVLHLDFSKQTDIQDADLISILNKNPYIKFLNLEGCKNITDAGLASLTRLTQLTSLNLWECIQITDAGLEHLAGLTELSSLSLTFCSQVTHTGLQHLMGLKQLRALDVACCQVNDRSLEQFAAHLQQLTRLSLHGCSDLTDAGLRHLAGLQQLTYLNLYRCNKITDTGLQHLAGLTQLTWLSFIECQQISDAGLSHLSGLNSLTTLHLCNCTQLTDAGLEHLAGLAQLRTLYLYGCDKLTNNAKEQLKKQIPGLTIHA